MSGPNMFFSSPAVRDLIFLFSRQNSTQEYGYRIDDFIISMIVLLRIETQELDSPIDVRAVQPMCQGCLS